LVTSYENQGGKRHELPANTNLAATLGRR
jgi:hypothetical protein